MKNRFTFFLVLVLGLLTPCLSAAMTGGDKVAVAPVKQSAKIRAWHFVLRAVPLERARWMVDKARAAGLNTVIVCVTDGVTLRQAPWKLRQNAWTVEEFKSWVDYTKSKGMAVVPEIKLLTHQDKLFQNRHPGLMYNAATYDAKNEAVYAKVLPLLGEVIEVMRPHALHIGHDEVAGHKPYSKKKWLKPGEEILPADLFLKDVSRIHGYLKERGIETWMWGDMLISPQEFPEMKPGPLHGVVAGYGKPLRDKLPKDIVICDWHYGDAQPNFPSLAAMRKEGFRVLGTTWSNDTVIRNFSRYAAQHGAEGMIATSWFHVQRREWNVVEKIIRTSGEAFLKDFPDGK